MSVTEELRSIDPFGFWPRKQSAIIARPQVDGNDPGDYAFHSPYVLLGKGPIEFRGRFDRLAGNKGTLVVRVNELGVDDGGGGILIDTQSFPIASLVASGGEFRIVVDAKGGGCRYAIYGQITPTQAARAEGLELEVGGQSEAERYRRDLIAARETIFGASPLFTGLYELEMGEPTLEHPVSQACTVGQFSEPSYARWLGAMKRPLHRHRKQWEFIYILQALEYYGALKPKSRGLGFGVGEEPLPAIMASMGCYVTATDLPSEDARASVWGGTSEHAASLAGVRQPEIIDDASLERMVEFQAIDMTKIPGSLVGYDFTWSSCALEHLGSIADGLDFIERSIDCLSPGGIAVHTTELNLLSNNKTMDHEGTVLFRRRDFEEIAARLILQGHKVAKLNFQTGNTPFDDHVDVPPYSSNDHFKLVMSQYLTTSFGIVIEKGG